MSNRLCAVLAFATGLAIAASGHAQKAPEPGARLNFIACPLVRDTYVPAWLAQKDGELYYLGPQGDLGADFYPPQLGHKALIEGVVSPDGERISGGVVLSPVKVSVLPELDASCNTILPAAGFADPPHHRTPGPSNSREGERNRERPAPPQPPFKSESFDVPFAFDVSEHLFARDSRMVSAAASYAAAIKASAVEVIGYRSGALLSDGTRLQERADVASRRIAKIVGMLEHAGVSPAIVTSRRSDADFDGVDDYQTRRVAIVVKP